ncbi:hypothetical protein CPSG_07371 [Coccidioides posadasii str. Silveira]|uniref:Uncharacterized protein n=1 Tax=Coccidioides posadasii (strain RMSCC 757 / Silveira) TaxID=443226 RepID=E9DC19_COCPS|nr:hypothetical protein CPSG_07371 [Coccidioides posadasii str. Silveira]
MICQFSVHTKVVLSKAIRPGCQFITLDSHGMKATPQPYCEYLRNFIFLFHRFRLRAIVHIIFLGLECCFLQPPSGIVFNAGILVVGARILCFLGS